MPWRAETTTVAEALAEARRQLGPAAELELARDVLHKMVCPKCGAEEELFVSLGKVGLDKAACPACGAATREVVTFYKIRGTRARFCTGRWPGLGWPPFDVLIVRTGRPGRGTGAGRRRRHRAGAAAAADAGSADAGSADAGTDPVGGRGGTGVDVTVAAADMAEVGDAPDAAIDAAAVDAVDWPDRPLTGVNRRRPRRHVPGRLPPERARCDPPARPDPHRRRGRRRPDRHRLPGRPRPLPAGRARHPGHGRRQPQHQRHLHGRGLAADPDRDGPRLPPTRR